MPASILPETGLDVSVTSPRLFTVDAWWKGHPHYEWAESSGIPLQVIEKVHSDARENMAAVVAVNQFAMPQVGWLLRLVEQNVPVLMISDGILEYRNTWEHPQVAPGAVFQPVLGHKIACIGRAQARFLESWGNLGKCEVVGVPRFDRLLGRRPRVRVPHAPFRLLIMTAKTPGFTPDQLEKTARSLRDLRNALALTGSSPDQPAIEPVWRITAGLAEEIGVPNALRDTSGSDLATVLETVDAVITTPSTAMLEGMLQGVPVALLDYHQCPTYVPAAWQITAPEHIGDVLRELQAPPAPKMLYQQSILHDNLECRTPAAPRMVRLVETMVRIGAECRSRGEALSFPSRILADEQDGHHLPENQFDLSRLYPKHPVFANMNRTLLQVELGQLRFEQAQSRAEAGRLRAEIAELHEIVRQHREVLQRFESHPLLGRLLRVRRRVLSALGRRGS